MCKYSDDWLTIAWPYYDTTKENSNDYRVTSIYDVYCNKCKKFVNLLSGEEIDPDGRVFIR